VNEHPFVHYQPGKHLPVLDGLRGLAVSLVLAFHFFSLNFGWLGVDLFFILSGFLITGILIDSKEHPSYFKNFYAKRTLRIFPLYYLALSAVILLIAFKGPDLNLNNYQYFLNHSGWFFSYLQNWLWSFDNWPPDKLIDHLWSLAIEEQFYLFWPLLVYFVPTRNLIYVAVSMIVIAIISRYVTYYAGYSATPVQYVNTICRMDSLSIGACIAILIRTRPERLVYLVKMVCYVVVPLTVYMCFDAQSYKYNHYHYSTIGYTLFDLICGVVLLVSFTDWLPIYNKFLSSSVMRWLGKYSYGLYVYHWIIYSFALQFVKPYLKTNFTFMPIWLSYGTVCLIATVLVAKLSFDYFEYPILKLKKHFSK